MWSFVPSFCLSFVLSNRITHERVKAAFHYSSQLQTWSKTWSQAGQKHVESQLQTCLKRVFLHSICLARARTSEPAAVRDQVLEKKSKADRKRVTNPHELVETWLQTWSKTRFAARFGYEYSVWGNTSSCYQGASVPWCSVENMTTGKRAHWSRNYSRNIRNLPFSSLHLSTLRRRRLFNSYL